MNRRSPAVEDTQLSLGHPVRTIALLALIYAVMGLVGLQLAIPPSTASPLFPAAGFALAAVLWYGWPAIVAAAVGQFVMQMARCWLEGNGWPPVQLMLAVGFAVGAAAQAAAAAELVKRWTGNAWRELAFERQLFGFLIVGGGIACLISATVGMTCLGIVGFVPLAELPYEGWKWYVGDTLGVFIFAPLTLVLLAGGRGGWRPDSRRVVLKMLVIFGLVMIAFVGAGRWEQAARQRQLANEGNLVAVRLADRLRLRVGGFRLTRSLLAADKDSTTTVPVVARRWFQAADDIVFIAWCPPADATGQSPAEQCLIEVRREAVVADDLPAAVADLAAAAVAAGELRASGRVALGQPSPDQSPGLLIAVPGDDAETLPATEGCLVAGLDQRRLIREVITDLPTGLELKVDGASLGNWDDEGVLRDGALRWAGRLPLQWLEWQVELTADSRYLKGEFDVTWIVAILSLLFSALFADRDVAISAAVSREEIAHEAKRQLEQELLIAHHIQKGLLPRRPPNLPGFELAGCSRPAAQTGGDFYDLMPLPDGRVAVAIADVTGHGLGPALVAAEVRALFRALIGRGESLGEVVGAMHRLLAADLPAERLVTACFVVVDAATGRLEYVSAGHGPLLLCRASGELEELPAQGLPFGFLDEPPTEPAGQIVLEPGDLFVLTTDGFFEAADSSGRPFGVAALAAVVRQHRQAPADRLVAALERSLALFLGGTPPQDDLTAVVLKRATAEPAAADQSS